MKTNTIYGTVGLVNLLTIDIPHLEVPDPGGAVLSSCVHPLSVLLEADSHDILADPFVVDDRIEILRRQVKQSKKMCQQKSYFFSHLALCVDNPLLQSCFRPRLWRGY